MYEAIVTVDGESIPVQPSYYQLIYSDVSDEQAGRTEDVEMHKSQIGTVTGIDLGWQNLTTSVASLIANLFWPEYVNVKFLDLKAGGYITKRFYSGDITAPLYSAKTGRWESIKFNLRSKKGHVNDESGEL
ncbi:MAG TPA: hypothetical protein VFC68_03005 [Treponemataceae bacterium]|nr:hypothetical protein [Treponemataceae bacterium]